MVVELVGRPVGWLAGWLLLFQGGNALGRWKGLLSIFVDLIFDLILCYLSS